jgi:hypothetical protein
MFPIEPELFQSKAPDIEPAQLQISRTSSDPYIYIEPAFRHVNITSAAQDIHNRYCSRNLESLDPYLEPVLLQISRTSTDPDN